MSPKAGGRAQRRQRRNLLISVIVVVAISLGSFAAVVAARWSPRLGLDLAGGVAVVYTAQGAHVTPSDLDETVNILNLRVNGLGVSGAQVQTTGKNQISVSIPGVKDAQQVLNQIGETARMYFRPVLCFGYPQAIPKNKKDAPPLRGIATIPACSPSTELTASNLNVQPNNSPQGYSENNVPPDPQYEAYPSTDVAKPNYPSSTVLLPGLQGACGLHGLRCVLGPAQMTGRSIGSARPPRTRPASGWSTTPWRVPPDRRCGTRWPRRTSTSCSGSSSTATCTRRPSSSRPRPVSPRSTAGVRSRGNLTEADAQDLAQAMNYGALPVTLKAATSQTVTPTLGHAALIAGLAAGIGGLILVLLYVVAYYRALGLVVISGLVFTAMMLWAIISGLGHTSGRAELRPGRHHRSHRVHRHHRRLVHRLFRATEGRDPFRTLRADVGGPRLQERLADGLGRRLRLLAGGHRPVLRGRRQCEGLRVLPRALDDHGHGRHLVLHPAARDPPRAERAAPGLGCLQHLHRARRGPPGARRGRRRRHGRRQRAGGGS